MSNTSEAVLIFSSAHYMLRAEQALLDGGLNIELVAAPQAAGELCTTAICFHADLEERVRAILAERRVEFKDLMPYPRPKAVHRAPSMEEITAMLEARGAASLATLVEAGKVTERAFGMRVSLMAIVGPEGAGCEEALGLGIPLVLIDLTQNRPDLASLKACVEGDRCIGTALAPRLDASLIEDLRSCGVRYCIATGPDPADLSAGELAEELIFLRDNRLGIVGTGSLIPLIDHPAGADRGRTIRLLAAARLVMPDAYIPAPAWLWHDGIPGACNLMLVDAAGGELMSSVDKLRKMLKRSGRRLLASVEERCS